MSDAERDPHVLVSARLRTNPKLIELPSDRARWGWIVLLGEAKLARPAGRFASRRVLDALMGTHRGYVPEYLRVGLLHVSPELCDECLGCVGVTHVGEVVVHDWSKHQREASRGHQWRLAHGYASGHLNLDGETTGRRTGDTEGDRGETEGNKGGDHPGFADLSRASAHVPGGVRALARTRTSAHRARGLGTGIRGDNGETSGDTLARAAAHSHSQSQSPSTEERGVGGETDEPEFEALQWLAAHGCYVRPGDGYHRRLIGACERHSPNAIVGMLDRLSRAGVKDGDFKGLLWGAIDALDAQNRPKLADLEAEERAEERGRSFDDRVKATRGKTSELAAMLAEQYAAESKP